MRLLPLLLLLITASSFSQQQPNIIYIMTDDHDKDAISAYGRKYIETPHIDRLAKEGMLFNKAFVGNSICSPARATLLTGQHSHKNGVKDNRTPFDPAKTTIAHLLNDAGYQTALVGKWHLHKYPSGFHYWKILPGQGLYFDPRWITMKGDTITEKGYATDVITKNAIEWLDKRDPNKPFALLLHHKAPHRNFVPNLKYLEKFHKVHFSEPPTLYVDTNNRGSAWRIQTMSILNDMRLTGDLKVDPNTIEDLPEFKASESDIATYNAIMRRYPPEELARFKEIYAERGRILKEKRPKGKELLKYKFQWFMQDYIACVASIDENIGIVLDWLDKNDLTKTTAVIYTSDQGFYLGDNGWFDKRFMYDVSMSTPLIIRWPGHVKPGKKITAMVQNIDYAPTILGIAGVEVPESMQGLNLEPLITGRQSSIPRKNLYYHYYEYVRDHTVIPHLGVRGERYKLVYFYTVDEWEFYDLHTDPLEQKNLIHSKIYQGKIEEMKKVLKDLRDQYDDHEEAGELR